MLKLLDKKDQEFNMDNEIIRFIEIMSRAPLNSSWHHFALLMEDRTDTFEEIGEWKKSRKFQVYYKHKLTYEGHLCWSYPNAGSGRYRVEMSVRFDKIRRGGQVDLLQEGYHFTIDLMDYWNEDQQAFQVDSMQLPSQLHAYDQKRIKVILKKWGLNRPVTLSLEHADEEQMELFTNRLISSAVLVKAAEQRPFHSMAFTSSDEN